MALGVGLKSITFGSEHELLSELAIHSLLQNCPKIEQIVIKMPLPIGRLKVSKIDTYRSDNNIVVISDCHQLYGLFQDLAHLKRLKVQLDRDCEGFEDLFSRPLSQLRSFKADGFINLTDSQLELIADR